MKILFLCKRFYTSKDLIGDRFGRLFHIPVQLARLGAEVSVIALDYRNACATETMIEGVAFRAEPAKASRLVGTMFRLRQTVRNSRPDVIIASGDSHIGFFARLLSLSVGAKFVFDVYDYYPAFSGNRLPGMKPMFRAAVRKADLVFCASVPLLDKLLVQNQHVALVENGVDRAVFFPMDKRSARESLGLPIDSPIFGYFGAITPKRGPLLLQAAELLRAEFGGLRVLMAGPIIGINPSSEFLDYRGILPQSGLSLLIAACDVVVVPYERDAQIDLSGACKIAEYLACERPVVATRVAGHELIFGDTPDSLCEPIASDLARALSACFDKPRIAPFPDKYDWSNIGRSVMDSIWAL
ncbi:glycosyltransferase family 4 protein [Thioalkalivibrio sp. XN279]|uniref:glycosyltransferase family 4 protein n=1 Tax=Thioalkalivibrio sp. XN279 TaxID=2714953 RepID=UPI00140D6E02|nr:glycosyltransferase family 4 protein [Thioalkalivibrio sp. XN279]NHA16057.1 glycosyltransferase family 4 protein [Thioalkalivibrio sp. XN279]